MPLMIWPPTKTIRGKPASMPPVSRHAVAWQLRENPAVRAMFVAHLQQALNDTMEKQHERQTIRPEQQAGAADLITVRAARILGQLDVLYAPAGRKGGDNWRSPSYAKYRHPRRSAAAIFPMSADSAEEAVWNDVAAALARRWRRTGRSGLSPSATPCCSTFSGLSAAADWLPGLAELYWRYLLRRHYRADAPLAMEQQSWR